MVLGGWLRCPFNFTRRLSLRERERERVEKDYIKEWRHPTRPFPFLLNLIINY